MTCREFERTLDVLLEARRSPLGPQPDLDRHAGGCASCAELLALARLPEASAVGVADDVLARTGDRACRQAEESLNDFVGGLLPSPRDRELVAGHLEHCRTCFALASELERLTRDLPGLGVVRPEAGFVDDVLRRTLPLPVRVRRRWAKSWPQWIRRPRFAAELSFAATLVLVVILATPGSPLQAMPERAVEFARTESLRRLEALPSRARRELTSSLRTAAEFGERGVVRLAESTRAGFGTISDEVASWFVPADGEPSAQDQPKQETP